MPDRPTISRRRLLGLFAAGSAVAACGETATPALKPPAAAAHVKVGLVWPQSGPNAAIGTDIKRGWDLWLTQNGGKLGEFVADVVPADEGATPATAVAAVQKLLQTDKVDMLVGLVDNAATLAVIPVVEAAKKLMIVAGASAIDITRKAQTGYVWRTSFSDPQLAAPMGAQLAQSPARDGIYVVAPSDAEGTATLTAFQTAFVSGGGTIAGTGRPVAGAPDYQRFFPLIQRAKAKGTYCALPAADGAAFLTQYAKAGLAGSIPLYGSGPLTEGGVLAQEGQAAVGVQSTLHYSDQLTTPANTAFVAAYKAAYQAAPSCYSVQGYDAGMVLDGGLSEVGQLLDGDSMSNQMGKGNDYKSPRGRWKFSEQTPLQDVYLRKVQDSGGTLVNAVLYDLGPSGQPLG